MLKIYKAKITTRSVLYIGFRCNIKCKFCYYAHTQKKDWESIDECRKAALLLRSRYNIRAVDITGGEPTIYPNIHELLKYCKEIGLSATLITNSQILANAEHVQEFKNSGITDFLVSVHGYGDCYNQITTTRDGFEKVVRALDNIAKYEIPFRVNVTITKASYQDLKKIADFVVSKGAKVINYISYNPAYDWEDILDQDFQVKHSDVRPYLVDALNYCDSIGLEANVRYMPFCMLEGHENKCYNFAQLSYDPGEWDYKSWYSTKLYYPSDKIPDKFYNFLNKESAYYLAARRQTESMYCDSDKCNHCALRNICDGLTQQYFQRYGDLELKPKEGLRINQPNFFVANRNKVLTTWR